MQTYMKEWKKGKPERNGREGPLLFCKELTTMAVKTVRRLGKNISNVAKEMGANHRTNERQCKGTPPTVYVSTKSGFFLFLYSLPPHIAIPTLIPLLLETLLVRGVKRARKHTGGVREHQRSFLTYFDFIFVDGMLRCRN